MQLVRHKFLIGGLISAWLVVGGTLGDVSVGAKLYVLALTSIIAVGVGYFLDAVLSCVTPSRDVDHAGLESTERVDDDMKGVGRRLVTTRHIPSWISRYGRRF